MMPRVVRHHPAYLAFGTVSLALAVGATLAVFTVFNALSRRMGISCACPEALAASCSPELHSSSFGAGAGHRKYLSPADDPPGTATGDGKSEAG